MWLQGGGHGCGGGHVWLPGGACVAAGGHASGGMHGWGACMVTGGMHGCRGHVWLWGDMHGCRGHVWLWGMHRIQRDMVNERVVHILLECILVAITSGS